MEIQLVSRYGEIKTCTKYIFVDSQPSTDVLAVFWRHSDIASDILSDFKLNASYALMYTVYSSMAVYILGEVWFVYGFHIL